MRWTAASPPAGAAVSRLPSTSTTPATPRARWSAPTSRGSIPNQVQLEVRGRELVLSGHRETESQSDDRVYQQLEIERGPFRRVVALGAEVDADAANATYEDGILTVELPLLRPARPRTVQIRGTER